MTQRQTQEVFRIFLKINTMSTAFGGFNAKATDKDSPAQMLFSNSQQFDCHAQGVTRNFAGVIGI